MSKMSSQEALAYLSRWRLVHEVEVVELQRTSIETKLRQLESLVASRDLFGTDPDRAVEEGKVHERWAHLRRTLSA